ncbi:MAG: ATP-binding protein [Salinibacter sp.]
MTRAQFRRCAVPRWSTPAILVLLSGVLLGGGPIDGPEQSPSAPSVLSDSIKAISAVRVDADGNRVPDRLGDTVAVAGRTVVTRGVFMPSAFISLQDRTGGIHVLLPEGPSLARGDSVRVQGVVEYKYGLTQLRALDYDVIEAESRLPAPLPLTVPTADGERYEGEFVRVRGEVLRVSSNKGGKYLLMGDRGGETTAQISVFVPNRSLSRVRLGRFEAGDEVAVTGVLSQHDFTKPYSEYYQVLPRDKADIARIGVLSPYLRIGFFVLLGGGILAVVAVVMLRSAVKRRTQELAESRARFRRLAEATVEGILLHDEGKIIDANDALADMLGRDREDLVGRKVDSVLSVLTHDLDGASVGATEEDVTEAEIVRQDGTTIPVEIRARDVTVGERTVQVTALRDISKRREWEEGILRAKREAEEVAQLKTAMLANMSHEIRTPLTSTIGFAEVLKNNLEGEMAQLAEKAYHSGQRLMQTLDSVLRLSRLEAGAYQLDCTLVQLDRVVTDTAEMLRPNAEEKSVALDTEVSDVPVEGYWNEDAMNRIVENLLENGIKFTPEGGRVDLRVRTNREVAVLEVADTGIGMAPEQVSGLFRAFKQESEGLAREYEGSGLGLSVVRRLVEAHDGTIDVETEKGVGSTFIVTLPLQPEGPAAASSSENTEAGGAQQ